jgi:alpha-1,2-mannosyltransferase
MKGAMDLADSPVRQAAHGPPFVYWTCLWGIGLSVAIVAIGADLTIRASHVPPGRDFANLYTAGWLALHGNAWEAFDPNWFRLALHRLVGALTLQNYSYPPHALFLAVPFAVLPYPLAFAAFTLFGALAFYLAARPHAPFAPVLALLTPAAALNMWNGHYGLFLGALWLVFFRNLQTRPARAGLAAAALTFKPHLGLFIAIAALTQRTALLVAAAGTIGLIILSGFLFGFDNWISFFTATITEQQDVLTRTTGDFYFRMMPSVYVAYGGGLAGAALQAVIVAIVFIMLFRHRTLDPFALATATFLVLPYAFNYDMTVACLGYAAMLYRYWDRMNWIERIGLSLAFLVPNICFVARPVVPPILLYALWLQLNFDAKEDLMAPRERELDVLRA